VHDLSQVTDHPAGVGITDFGLSKIRASVRASGMTGLVGKVNWMAPELADGKPHSFAADVYSLAMVIPLIICTAFPHSHCLLYMRRCSMNC
jgi:serine/threonine protein kinase